MLYTAHVIAHKSGSDVNAAIYTFQSAPFSRTNIKGLADNSLVAHQVGSKIINVTFL